MRCYPTTSKCKSLGKSGLIDTSTPKNLYFDGKSFQPLSKIKISEGFLCIGLLKNVSSVFPNYTRSVSSSSWVVWKSNEKYDGFCSFIWAVLNLEKRLMDSYPKLS